MFKLLKNIRPIHIKQCTTTTSVRVNSTQEKFTHFGFETVKEDEKERKVHNVFESIADKYDLMNDAMSMGVHRVWKDIFVNTLGPCRGMKMLDVAGGTGDISFRVAKYLNTLPANDAVSEITVSDINQAMLDVGFKRAQNLNLENDLVKINWLCANCESFDNVDDCSFTVYTIAFGIRNVTHIDKALKEAYRVLQPGGRFLCLEFSQVNNELFRWVYDNYSFQVIPVMGKLLAGQWEPYQYLVESIRRFPDQETFKGMIEEAGFKYVRYDNLFNGICAIHSGFKL